MKPQTAPNAGQLPSGSLREPASKSWLRAIEGTATIDANPSRLLADIVHEQAARDGVRPALLSDRETLTYAALSSRINQYARWARACGIGKGAAVALLMPNRPEYLAIWLGLTQAGGVVALLNTQLKGAALAHCIAVSGATHVIADAVLDPRLAEALPHLDTVPRIWLHGGQGADRIDLAIQHLDDRPLATDERPSLTVNDTALLIYTSGTTGLPKAARVSHRRILSWGLWFSGLIDASLDDRLYDCLPLYHSVGGVAAVGCMLAAGGSVVISEKFSTRSFWDDIVRWDCTAFQYIGELCRYLLKAPRSVNETRHRLRIGCGNGLRGDIWDAFKARFAIPQILEFYAATEGNFSLFNVEGKAGAIGRIPSFLAHRFPAALVRFDVGAGAPVRNERGFCIRCAPGETGEAIGRVGETKTGGGAFEGYTNDAETNRKILRNVFAEGDAWFRTGDLMMRDSQGYFYFVDRIGDTFRWKGENVATLEVAEVVAAAPGVRDAAAYGVTVPGADGKAGMAAIAVDQTFSLSAFHRHLAERLPAYAVPLFVRILPALALTETFKQKKQELVSEAFDPSIVGDPLFCLQAGERYVALSAPLYERIAKGEIRF